MEHRGSEIDQESGLDPTESQVAEELSDVIIDEGARRLEFNNEAMLREHAGKKFTQQSAILVIASQRMLLLHTQGRRAG